MTILDALKGLYAKLGGKKSPDNIQTIGEALEDITTVTVNGSDALPAVTAVDNGDVLTVVSGEWAKAAPTNPLPSVTSDDNGDVLTVVEGAWAKAAPSGGGGLTPHIHFSYDDGGYTAESDVSFADLIADWDSVDYKFSTYDPVYVTDNYGIAVKCEVHNGAIEATCLNPDTSGGGTTFNLYAVRYTWDGTAVTRDEFSLVVV